MLFLKVGMLCVCSDPFTLVTFRSFPLRDKIPTVRPMDNQCNHTALDEFEWVCLYMCVVYSLYRMRVCLWLVTFTIIDYYVEGVIPRGGKLILSPSLVYEQRYQMKKQQSSRISIYTQ